MLLKHYNATLNVRINVILYLKGIDKVISQNTVGDAFATMTKKKDLDYIHADLCALNHNVVKHHSKRHKEICTLANCPLSSTAWLVLTRLYTTEPSSPLFHETGH